VTTSRLAAIAAATVAAPAALLSFGAVTFTGSAPATLPAGARLGILSLDAWHVTAAIAAAIVVLVIGWKADRGVAVLAAVSPLALVFLPWLPLGVPGAFLIWTGGVLSLVWLVTAIALARVALAQTQLSFPAGRQSQVLLAGALSFVVFSTAAWLASPSIPSGDEPEYLLVTQSLLYDHDLQIENNHQRGDYRVYFSGELAPRSVRRGRNGALYSIHAPGLPALVLPAFALAGYRGVVIFLIVCAAAASALAWWLGWRVSGSASGAWFGWAVVTFAAPWLLETYTVLPDGPGALIVLTGFWALVVAGEEGHEGGEGHEGAFAVVPWFLFGVALALLPWLHTRFAVLAATLGGLVLVRLARVGNATGKAIVFLLPPAISAVAWMFFFAIIYGTPDPTAPYGGETQNMLGFLPNGLGGLLFDQGFGLLATAPVLAIACAGFARTRRLFLEWLVMALPYVLTVTTFATWWAGMSGPARLFVPLLLPLAIPAACAWTWLRSLGWRTVMMASLVVSVWLSAVMAGGGGGRLGYHARNDNGLTAAPWMDWATHVVDLPSAAPAFVPPAAALVAADRRLPPDPNGLAARVRATQSGFTATLPWLLSAGAAVFAVVWLLDRGRPRAAPYAIPIAAITFAMAAMTASTVVWRMQDTPADPVPSQIDALRLLASPRAAAFDVTGRHRISRDAARGMTLEVRVPPRGGRGGPRPLNRPLAVFPSVPAGSYLLQVTRRGGADGWVMAGIGNDQFAIVTQPIGAFDAGVRVDLPVDVRAINVRADEGARDQLEAIDLRPLQMAGAPHGATMARRAVRYGSTVVYFLDDRSFPEPSGFWVGGARDTTVAAHSDQREAAIAFVIRNGAADNRVLLEAGAWRGDVALKAGEERRVDVPLDVSGTVILRVHSEGGFRPSEADGRSRDTRLLGVFVRLEQAGARAD
jgi:hypothetical protein